MGLHQLNPTKCDCWCHTTATYGDECCKCGGSGVLETNATPDVETFYMAPIDNRVESMRDGGNPKQPGWYWWEFSQGMKIHSTPHHGPYTTEGQALTAAHKVLANAHSSD